MSNDTHHQIDISYISEEVQVSTAHNLLQVFGTIDGDVYVLQQRSPAALGREEAFASSMAAWIAQQKFKEVLCSSGQIYVAA